MTSRAKIEKTLRRERRRLGTWRAVSESLFDGEIHTAVLSRIANPDDDYWPVDKDILAIINPPRIILPDTECIRTLKVYGTEHELREAQRLSTRERMERCLVEEPVTANVCCNCGHEVQFVRPGKWQCNNCDARARSIE